MKCVWIAGLITIDATTFAHGGCFVSTVIKQRRFNLLNSKNALSTYERIDHNNEFESLHSTFWYAMKSNTDKKKKNVPSETFLDEDGPLPLGCYQKATRASNDEPLKACLLTIAIDLDPKRPPNRYDTFSFYGGTEDRLEVVKGLQRMVDRGLNTFQLSDMTNKNNTSIYPFEEEILFGMMRQSTPRSVMSSCHITTKINVPSIGVQPFHPSSVRKDVTDSILRVGGEFLDCLQIRCKRVI